jgi:hypothetical protein
VSIKSNTILLVFVLLFVYSAQAQPRCGFDLLHKKILDQSPAYKARVEDLEKLILSKNSSRASRNDIQTEQLNTALYTIPVVIHVIHTGSAIGSQDNPVDAQLAGTIDYLNSVYGGTMPGIEGVGDMQIQFVLATLDPNCKPTTGIDRFNGTVLPLYESNGVNAQGSSGEDELAVKNLVRWDPTKYFNIWVVNKIDGQDGTTGTFVGGFAYFPGAPQVYDGAIVLATQMDINKRTLPHEMGHAFGVFHPFQGASGSTCSVDADCTIQGDRVCDTDPITQSFTCRTGTNDCTGTPYSINTEKNFMSYSGCATLFTAGQKVRMLAAAASSFRTYGGTWALKTGYPIPSFNSPSSANCSPVTSSTGLSSNYGGVMNLTLNGVSVSSGTSFSDGGYRNNASSCQSLYYLIEGQSYSISMRLYGLNAEQARVWIDFNNDGSFNNAEELIGGISESSIPGSRPGGLTINLPVSIPASAVKDQVIRMRVVEDLSTIYGTQTVNSACINPEYGQAEDFPVFIRSLALLPVDLISFNGNADRNDAVLRWQTGTEQNSARFDIERSTNGVDYLKIGEVAAKGIASVYQFNDQNLQDGGYYYRLRQVDNDGRSIYSRSIKLNISTAASNSYRILNNPAHQYVDILMPSQRSISSARIMDMNGRVVSQYTIPTGTGNYRIQGIDRLSPGIYVVEIQTTTERKVLKFVKN